MSLNTNETLQGRYRIVSLLGEGGMAAVYHAKHVKLGVSMAVKEMVPQQGIDAQTLAQLRQQFLQEAQVLARLNHPHLVRVSDFFEDKGNAYLVMNFVEGESLAERIKREGSLAEEQVLTWAGQLLDALAYCHAQGVIHRDVKPQNVIIRSDGRAVLVDFGLVKLWDPSDPRTKTQMRGMGTPEYAPPEQYEVQMGHTDARSDIYGLGATLYHAMVGQAPVTATMRMADPEEFAALRKAAPDVSEQTETAVMRALELARSQRWQDAAEMADALGLSIPEWKREERDEKTSAAVKVPDKTRKMEPESDKMVAAPAAAGEASARAIPAPTAVEAPIAEPARPPLRISGWAWALVGLVVLALGIGGTTAMGGFGLALPFGNKPTPTPTWTVTPSPPPTQVATATLMASETPESTPTEEPTRTPTHTPTHTPTTPPTPTEIPTETPLPSPTATPEPRAVAPRLTAPAQGGEYKSPVTFQWSGSLGSGQAYQVTAYHNGHTLQSGPLTAAQWVAELPGETVGEWHWKVSVIQGGSEIAASSEWVFWFNPHPGGGGGGNDGNGGKPTPKP